MIAAMTDYLLGALGALVLAAIIGVAILYGGWAAFGTAVVVLLVAIVVQLTRIADRPRP